MTRHVAQMVKSGQIDLARAREFLKQFGGKVRDLGSEFKPMSSKAVTAFHDIGKSANSELGKAANSGKKHTDKLRRDVVGNVKAMGDGVRGGLENIVNNTNKALKGFGVKKQQYVAFEAERANLPQGNQRGGIIHALRGTLVPGRGNGDRVPAMLEPGEVVVNKRAVAAAGGARRVNRINQMIPRFATGGVAEPPGDPGSEVVQAAYAQEVGAFLRKFNMDLTQGYNPGGPSVSPGHLSLSAAPSLDVTPLDGNWDGLFAKGLQWALSQGMQVGYDGQYGTQSWSNHGEGNHAHIDWKSGGKLGGAIAKIKDMVLKGPAGPLRDMGQRALDKSVDGANQMLSKMMPGPDAMGIGTYKGPLDRVFPATSLASPGVQLSPAQVKSVMRPAGLPSVFSGIAVDESGNHPGIIGYDPGGTRGLGLWQITTGFNDDIIRKYGGETQMRNPVRNALAAAAIFARQPSAWAASGNAMQKGGIVGMQGGGVAGQGGEDPKTPLHDWFGMMYTKPIVGRMKEIVGNIGPAPVRFENMSNQYGKALDHSELATVAGAGDYTDPNGVMTWGIVDGRTAVGGLGSDAGQGWLDMQLLELLDLRNKMLAAKKVVEALTGFVKGKIKALTGPKGYIKKAADLLKDAERIYNNLKRDVERLQRQISELEKIKNPTREQAMRLADKKVQLHDTVDKLAVAKQKLDDAKFRAGAVEDVAGAFTARQGGLGETLASILTGGADDGSWPSLESLQGRTGKAGEIFDVQTEIAAALRSFGESTTGIPSDVPGSTGSTAAADLAGQLTADDVAHLQKELALSQAQYGVFAQLGLRRGGVVPALAAGGKIASGGWALVGEQGPELARLPGGAQVYPNTESQSIMEPQPVNVRVFIGDRELTDIVRVETDDRLTRLTSHATARGGVPGRKAGR
jgi:hypothetical protein